MYNITLMDNTAPGQGLTLIVNSTVYAT